MYIIILIDFVSSNLGKIIQIVTHNEPEGGSQSSSDHEHVGDQNRAGQGEQPLPAERIGTAGQSEQPAPAELRGASSQNEQPPSEGMYIHMPHVHWNSRSK